MVKAKQFFSVSEVARMLGVPPRMLSDLFYARRLNDERCPIVARHRLIPEDYIAEVTMIVRETEKAIRKKAES